MTKAGLKLGEIYLTEWDERPHRVIGFDDIEVFYDSLCHDNTWTFPGNFKKKCSFYRTSAPFFIAKSKPIDYLPLTDEEKNAFRPELPLRLCRTKEFNWNGVNANSYQDFIEQTKKVSDRSFLDPKLLADKIVLIPLGNKGGEKKGTVVAADNGVYFKVPELIWKAEQLHRVVNDEISNGIGLYRLGFEKGLPSYYIGDYLDKAGLLRD